MARLFMQTTYTIKSVRKPGESKLMRGTHAKTHISHTYLYIYNRKYCLVFTKRQQKYIQRINRTCGWRGGEII